MKAAFVVGKNRVGLKERDVPKLGEGDILVKMRAGGICGTDIEKMRGESVTSLVLGHEVAGDVVKIGGDVKDFRIGERVAVHHHVPCYKCHFCRHGDYTMCEEFSKVNIDPCGFAEYFRVPAAIVSRGGLVRLPSNLSYEEGALLEPTACCLRAVKKSQIEPGDSVLVVGCGPTGVTHIQLLKEMGCGLVIGADIVADRLNWARRFGADQILDSASTDFVPNVQSWTEGRGVDAAIVATGSVSAIRQGFETVRRGGRIVMFGAPPKGSLITYDASTLFIREIKLIPSYSTSEVEINMALRMVSARRIDLASLVTHRFDLNRFVQAMKFATESKDALKIMIMNK